MRRLINLMEGRHSLVYTIGDKRFYLRYIKQGGRKLGKTDDYEGGIVFHTAVEAERFLANSNKRRLFSVYGVLADWDRDTYNTGEIFNHLLHSARLVAIKS